MRRRLIVIAASLVAAGTLGAVVYAQLGATQTASGTVNVSTTSADLYICEPDSTPGPDCGSDDAGADEMVFETLEDMRPGDRIEWDIRLKNVGTQDWLVTDVTLEILESVDPGADCPDDALQPPEIPSVPFVGGTPIEIGIFILGKNGDGRNDNPFGIPGVPVFQFDRSFPEVVVSIKVAAGDYEDVRLELVMGGAGTENCDGNEWNVSWEFTVA